MSKRRPIRASVFSGVLSVALALAALACMARPALATQDDNRQHPILKDVGIDQKLNASLPPNAVFRDENGRAVRLCDLYRGKPMILTLVYYQCPMLCTMVLDDLSRVLNAMSQSVGNQFDVIVISFDPRDTPAIAAQKKAQYIRSYRRPGAAAGWHFLTGTSDSIHQVADAVGFKYKWDPKYNDFAHASGIIVLTPSGRVSRYFFGVDYVANDVRFALDEAAGGTIGSPSEKVLLYCFQYDPTTGRYGLAISRILRMLGILTVIILGAFVLICLRRERRSGGPGSSATHAPPAHPLETHDVRSR